MIEDMEQQEVRNEKKKNKNKKPEKRKRNNQRVAGDEEEGEHVEGTVRKRKSGNSILSSLTLYRCIDGYVFGRDSIQKHTCAFAPFEKAIVFE